MDYETAVEKMNEVTSAHVEYETTHQDAGNNYAHMPAESWCSEGEKRLAEQLKEFEIKTDLPIDEISDIALENFEMVNGSIHGPFANRPMIVLESYPVQEVEIQVTETLAAMPDDIRSQVVDGNDTDAFITGTDCAYVTTDAVWYAAINYTTLQTLLDDAA